MPLLATPGIRIEAVSNINEMKKNYKRKTTNESFQKLQFHPITMKFISTNEMEAIGN